MLFTQPRVLAQITSDSTLGSESSVINNNIISNGARRGTNLFHSFQEFNVDPGQQVYFANPDGVENIVSRVTGSTPSNILGKLGVNGSANLFLLNPNGIVFGKDASLDIRGSFIASTANRLNFSDDSFFSATNPTTTTLLSVNVPVGLQFGEAASSIINRSQASPQGTTNLEGQPVGLQVQPGKTLALIGSGVSLENGNLTAADNLGIDQGGRIEIGSVAAPSLVSLTPIAQGWAFTYASGQNFKDIQLSQSTIDVSGSGGGEVQLAGAQITLDNSLIESFTQSNSKGGDININGSQLLLQNGSLVTTLTYGEGRGGNLFVNALESVQVSGVSGQNAAGFLTQTFATGDAGNLSINTGRLLLQNGGQVGASTFASGNGGNVTVNATNSVEIQGIISTDAGDKASGIFTQVASGAAGSGGTLTINTSKLLIQDGASVSVGTLSDSTGKGGNLFVNAAESVELDGTGTQANGQVTPSRLFAASNGVGNAGDLTIFTRSLNVTNQAEVNVSSSSSGNAGNLLLTARSIRLDTGEITAETESGQGGNIQLQAQDLLLLQRGSKISTTAGLEGTGGNGGNIDIGTNLLIALENSDITANAFTGTGGSIQISTQGIFRSSDSDITSSSEFGIDGVVEITTPNFWTSSALASLPVEVVDVSGLIATGCPAEVGRDASTFVYTGRGGTPPNPTEAVNSDTPLADLGEPIEIPGNRAATATVTKPTLVEVPTQLVEAQGWVMSDNGDIMLTATPATATSSNPWVTAADCHTVKPQS